MERRADTWVVPGHLRLDELDTATELRLTSSDGYSTISGLILEALGRTAVVGDKVQLEARREVVPTSPPTPRADAPATRRRVTRCPSARSATGPRPRRDDGPRAERAT